MAFSKISHHIEQLNHNVQAFLKAKLEYYELVILKKATAKVTKLLKVVILLLMFLMFLFFLSFGCAILIGRAINDLYLGFFIVSGGYFVVFLFFLLFGKQLIKRSVLKKISQKMSKRSLFKE